MCKKPFSFARIYFPFLGIASFVWFLIRVIPKPSRAAYPCMRVAAPFASTFVLWVLGIGTSSLFLRRFRVLISKSHYLTAAACIAAGAVTGGAFLSMHHQAAASIKANVPLGKAKGAIPGRVAWVYDSAATPWKGLGDGHWWESGKTNQEAVDRMMSRMIRDLAGQATDTASWDTLFKYFNREHGRGAQGYTTGEKIAVKTNLTFCNFFPVYCCVDSMTYSLNKKLDYMNTSPQVTRALLRQLVYVAGVRQSDIYIGDPVAYYPNEYYDSCHAEFPEVQYIDHAGKFGRTRATFSDEPIYWSCRPSGVKQDYLPVHYTEASYIISLANMKSHQGGGITLCAKNHYGSLIRLPIDSGYYDLHQSLACNTPETGSYRALVDIMGHPHLGGKTLLCLVDGLYAGNHNIDTVPHVWPVAPFNGGWTSSLFASQDPVAIECVLYDLFQLDDDPYAYPKMAGAEDYLIEAAQADNPPSGTFYDPNHAVATERLASLGVWEHWNNPVDRKYSRNLGTGSGIELVFVNNTTNAAHTGMRHSGAASGYSMKIMPNAATVELTLPVGGPLRLALFDARGRVVGNSSGLFLSQGMHNVNLAAVYGNRSLTAGRYLLALFGEGADAPHCVRSLTVYRKK